jgi:hypothetical protein
MTIELGCNVDVFIHFKKSMAFMVIILNYFLSSVVLRFNNNFQYYATKQLLPKWKSFSSLKSIKLIIVLRKIKVF